MQTQRMVLLALLTFGAATASAATLDRIKETGQIRLGYYADARPFTVGGASAGSAPEGYTAALCQKVADTVKAQLQLGELKVEWVPVTKDAAVNEVQRGNVDLLCTPTVPTLTRRQEVGYSIPVFPGGVRAVLRTDAAVALRRALAENPNAKPVWRGSPATTVLTGKKVAAMAGSTTEAWAKDRLKQFKIDATFVPVADYREGIQKLVNRDIDVFFGDRSVVLGVLDDQTRSAVTVMDRVFTHEPLALALARSDEDFRLVVDQALSESFSSSEFGPLYAKWVGEPDDATRVFFQWNTLSK